jgi:hypothetical protein
MPAEPPDPYVAFVRRNLDPLCRDAARVVGDARDADLLYTPVLTDVAARWRWLELLRTRLGRAGAAEAYLSAALARRARNWRPVDDRWQVEVEVWQGDAHPTVRARPRRRSSAAVRLAPVLPLPSRADDLPVAEAAVAWRHAYRANLRRRWAAAAIACFLVLMFMVRLYHDLAP